MSGRKPDPHPDSPPDADADDERSDIGRSVGARADTVKRGKGGVVKNQNRNAQ